MYVLNKINKDINIIIVHFRELGKRIILYRHKILYNKPKKLFTYDFKQNFNILKYETFRQFSQQIIFRELGYSKLMSS